MGVERSGAGIFIRCVARRRGDAERVFTAQGKRCMYIFGLSGDGGDVCGGKDEGSRGRAAVVMVRGKED